MGRAERAAPRGTGAGVPQVTPRLRLTLLGVGAMNSPGTRRPGCAARGLHPAVAAITLSGLVIEPRPVTHTSHPTWGIPAAPADGLGGVGPGVRAFPAWAAGADLMFADAAGWNRPIRFARWASGHMAALQVAEQAREHRVARLVFAHIGRPSLRAIDVGDRLPFGEWGQPGRTYQLPPHSDGAARHAQ